MLDEAYAEYADPEPEGPALLREGAPRLCVLRTFSKVYGLAALRVGYALASPEVADALDRVRPIFNVNQPAQEAALASLGEAEAVALRVEPRAPGARAACSTTLAGRGARPGAARRRTSSTRTSRAATGPRSRGGCSQEEGMLVRELPGFGAPAGIRVTRGHRRGERRLRRGARAGHGLRLTRPRRPARTHEVTALVWFTRDLRVHDHPALRAALDGHERVVPVFCFEDRLLSGRHASGPAHAVPARVPGRPRRRRSPTAAAAS